MKKEDIIIFGAGNFGKVAFKRLKSRYNILFFCDNDKNKWGTYLENIKIISVNELKNYKEYLVIIASTYYEEIYQQLKQEGFSRVASLSLNNSFINFYNNKLTFENYTYKIGFNKEITEEAKKIKRVLYVEAQHCIRTYKIAKTLSERGVRVDGAYLYCMPQDVYKGLQLPYGNILMIEDYSDLIEYINNSDYDIIHSSNEPDYLTNILLQTNKPVIHDNHDMMSLRGDIDDSYIVNEYIANKYSHGNIYVDYPIKTYAENKFKIEDKNMLVLNSYVLKEQLPDKYHKKLSSIDGEIHCVYEGNINNIKNNHRYIEDKFLQIAQQNIHVHFYTPNKDKYFWELENKNEYLHWEGICSPQRLPEEMTKYDLGILVLNVTNRNNDFLSSTFPNKIWDYLAAGLPIGVEDLPILKKFVTELNCGKVIEFNSIKENFTEIIKKEVGKDFLLKNRLTMNQQFNKIINYYAEVIDEYRSIKNK